MNMKKLILILLLINIFSSIVSAEQAATGLDILIGLRGKDFPTQAYACGVIDTLDLATFGSTKQSGIMYSHSFCIPDGTTRESEYSHIQNYLIIHTEDLKLLASVAIFAALHNEFICK